MDLEERQQIIHSIGIDFGYAPGEMPGETSLSFASDFHLLFALENAHNNHVLLHRHSREVIAHVGVVVRELCVGVSNLGFSIALIGGVWTKKKYRKNHYMKALLDFVHQKYLSRVVLFVLWSNELSFFQNFNYYLCVGQYSSYNEKKVFLKDFYIEDFRRLESSEYSQYAQQLQELYLKYNQQNGILGLKRSIQHWCEYAKIINAHLYVRFDDLGKIQQYFFMNKGLDLPRCIYEWGPHWREGELQQLGKRAFVYAPELHSNALAGVEIERKYLGLFKMGDELHFAKFMEKVSGGELEVLSIQQTKIEFKLNKLKEYFTLTFEELMCSLFGPNPAKDLEKTKMNGILTNTFYISGIDSV